MAGPKELKLKEKENRRNYIKNNENAVFSQDTDFVNYKNVLIETIHFSKNLG